MTSLVSRGPVAGMTPRSLGSHINRVKTTVFALKNPGRGFGADRVRSQKTWWGLVLTVFSHRLP